MGGTANSGPLIWGSAAKDKAAQVIANALDKGRTLDQALTLARDQTGWVPGQGNPHTIVNELIKHAPEGLVPQALKEGARGALNALQTAKPTLPAVAKEIGGAIVEWGKGVGTAIKEKVVASGLPQLAKGAAQWVAGNAGWIATGIAVAAVLVKLVPHLLSGIGAVVGLNQPAGDPSNTSWITGQDAGAGANAANSHGPRIAGGNGGASPGARNGGTPASPGDTGSQGGGGASAAAQGGPGAGTRVGGSDSSGLDPAAIGVIGTINGMLDQASKAGNSCAVPSLVFWQGELARLGVPEAASAARGLDRFKQSCREVATAAGCASSQYWDSQRASCRPVEADGGEGAKPKVAAGGHAHTKVKRTRVVRRVPHRRRPRGRAGANGAQIAGGIIGIVGAAVAAGGAGGHSHCGGYDC